ncbi:pilus assembly protein [Pseudomonas allokribbensis]|uniref:pilus assembly protein n=1 Tax=Pseudomonas allokribbensis TaxID=2774460 RepID=UPI001787CE95|nr:pilus assembly protein [Pseudomonas allokribbensis]
MKLRTSLPMLLGLLLLACGPAQAEGELMVMPATTRVFNNHEQNVTVKNMGDAPLYLSISLQKVMNPGLTPETKVALGQLERPGMLASPERLTLGPGQSRKVGLKSLFEPEAEELYRLYIVPVRSLKVNDAPKDKITAPMSVAIGYGVLVRHMPAPDKQRSGWSHGCNAGGITLTNTGNVRHVLSDVGKTGETVALFPGISQHFAGKTLSLRDKDQARTLDCP